MGQLFICVVKQEGRAVVENHCAVEHLYKKLAPTQSSDNAVNRNNTIGKHGKVGQNTLGLV